jgi:hypothetical protein
VIAHCLLLYLSDGCWEDLGVYKTGKQHENSVFIASSTGMIPQFLNESELLIGFIFLLFFDAIHNRSYGFCQIVDFRKPALVLGWDLTTFNPALFYQVLYCYANFGLAVQRVL